jgi:hypothetical protein
MASLLAVLRSLDVHFRLRLAVPVLCGNAADPMGLVVPLFDSNSPSVATSALAAGPPGGVRAPARLQQQDGRAARSKAKAFATLAAEHTSRVDLCAVALQALHSLQLLVANSTVELVGEVQVCCSVMLVVRECVCACTAAGFGFFCSQC